MADRKGNPYNKEMKPENQIDAPLPENTSTPRNQSSDAGSAHEFDTTIMETPAASRHYNPDMSDSSLMLTCVGHGMKDDGRKSEAAPLSTRGVSELEDKVPLQVYPTTAKNNDDKIRKSHLDGPGLELPEDIASLSEEKVISDTNVTKNSNNGGFALSGCQTELLQHEENLNHIAGGFDRNTEEPIKTPYEKGNAQSPPTSECTKRGPRKRKRPREESQARVESLNDVAISPAAKSSSIINQPLKDGSEAWKQNTKNSPVNPVRDLSEPPPPASARSRRSVQLREHSPLSSSSMTGEPRRVFFSSSTTIDRTSKRLTFLERNGVTKVNSVEECDILCVAKGELKKTGSLVLAVIFGKEVITDDWISSSILKGELLDPRSFLARDPSKEAEWKINLREAIERGKRGIKPFLNSSFFFTSAAKKDLGKGFQDLKAIAIHAGAKSVQVSSSIPKKLIISQMADNKSHQTFIIAAAQDDCELPALEEAGWRSFNKDIITLSVLRGAVDVEANEFLIQPQIHESNQPSSSSNKRMKRSSGKSR